MRKYKNPIKRLRCTIPVLALCLSLSAGNILYAKATEAGGQESGGEGQVSAAPAESTDSGLNDVIDEIDRVDDEIGDLENDLDQERENHDNLQQNKSELEDYLDMLNGQYQNLSSRISKVEKDITAQEKAIAAKEADIAAKKADIEAKEAEIAAKEAEITAKEAEITAIEASIAKTQAEIEETQADLDEQYEAMKLRIQFMYENSASAQYLELLLEAENLTSFLNQAEYIEAMLEYDQRMRERFQETKAALDAKKAALEEDEARLITEKKTLEAHRKELAQQQETLKKEQQTLEQENAALQNQKKELDNLRAKLKREQSSVANQQAASAGELQEYVNQLVSSSDTIHSYEDRIAAKKKYYDELLAKKKRLEEEEERRKAEQAANDTGGSISEGDSGIDSSIVVDTNSDDLTLLAAIIYCEAGGESYEGKLAVGYVIMNRVRSNKFPNSISAVVYQTNQFSPVGSGRLATILAMEADPDVKGKVTDACRQAAAEVLTGASNVGESLFFRTHKPVPQLVENLEANGVPYYIIGGHVFYHRWVAY